MLGLPKIVLVGLASKGNYMRRNIPSRISSPPRDLWSSFTWISLGLPHMIVLAKRSIALVIVDDYSRYTWVYFFKKKNETQQTVIEFANEAQRQHNSKILAIRSDNNTEFKNYTLDEFLGDEGIKHQYSAAYTPQQNGVAERKNRILIDAARTMMAEFKSPYKCWAESINTAFHATN